MRLRSTLLAVLLPGLMLAQQDIVNTEKGAYRDLGRGLIWGQSGIGGANNNFMFSPTNPDQGICVFLANNNPTSAHAITLQLWQTGDRRQLVYTGSSGRFLQDTIVSQITTVPAATMVSTFIHTNAAARAVVSISGTTTQAGSPDTLDLFMVETSHLACGPASAVQPISPFNIPTFGCTGQNSVTAGAGFVAIPNSTTTFASQSTCLISVMVNNTTGAPCTWWMTDGQGSPVSVVASAANPFSVSASSFLVIPFNGLKLTSGAKWGQTTAGCLTAAWLGVQ